jgi:DNA replication protein DnaC
MLEYLYDILNIIYIILLITLIIYIIIQLNNYFEGGFNDGNRDEVKIPDESIHSDDDDVITDNEKRTYKKYNQHAFEMGDIGDTPEESTDNGVKYEDFVKLIQDSDFIKGYKNALEYTFDYKEGIYKKKLKEVENDLITYKEDSNAIIGTHNTNRDKLKLSKNELLNILSTIESRKKNLSTDKIKNNFKLMIYHNKNGFNSLVGREEIKDNICSQIYAFSKNPKYFFTNFQNFIFYGNSGVGKTKLAETLAYIYCKSGILMREKYRCITTQELKSPYINESAKLTREILWSTLEGLLFIDEAYDWVPEKTFGFSTKADHGEESLTEAINFLDKNIGLSIVCMAGYHDKMQRVLENNQGMFRRFPNQIILSDYNAKQLTELLIKFIENTDEDITFNNHDASALYTLIDYVYKKKKEVFDKQAGSMLNLSSAILKSIYTSTLYKWSNTNGDNNIYLMTKGINNYLKSYGLYVSV